MYRRRHVCSRACVFAAGLIVALAGVPSPARASLAPVQYYVSLGDSLSVGIQPDASGQNVLTNEGYADQLYRIEKLRLPNLQLIKFGCSGETTDTMLHGGTPLSGVACYQAGDTQLKAAVAFLSAHRGAIALVTLDIGANDLDQCVSGLVIDSDCVTAGFTSTSRNLPEILATLKAAVAGGAPIVGMTYYDPYLAAWLAGPTGQAVAASSATTLAAFNALLKADYAAVRAPVADVERTFLTGQFAPTVSIEPFGVIPLNVAVICSWTWMCAPPPVGPNIHANANGYAAMAWTFAAAVPLRL